MGANESISIYMYCYIYTYLRKDVSLLQCLAFSEAAGACASEVKCLRMKIKDVLDLCAYRQIMFCGVSIRQYFKPYGTVWKGSRMIDDLDEANYIFYLHALSRDVDCKTCTNSISSLTNQNS